MPKNTFKKWQVGNNTYTVERILSKNKNSKIDFEINKKSLISEAIKDM